MKRRNALILFAVLTVVLLVADRITKALAVDVLTDNSPIAFLPGFLDFALVYNTGGAFGLFEGGQIVFVCIAVIALVAIVAYLIKAKDLRLPIVVALGMIASGALGNAYDRAVDGAVPDFIHTLFIEFPVFNVADICLTVGEFLLIIAVAYYWFGPKSREKQALEGVDAPAGQTNTLSQNEDTAVCHPERSKGFLLQEVKDSSHVLGMTNACQPEQPSCHPERSEGSFSGSETDSLDSALHNNTDNKDA